MFQDILLVESFYLVLYCYLWTPYYLFLKLWDQHLEVDVGCSFLFSENCVIVVQIHAVQVEKFVCFERDLTMQVFLDYRKL